MISSLRDHTKHNVLFNVKGHACSVEIHTDVLASMDHRYHNFWKNMGPLCLYHSRSDIHEDGIRIQYTGSMHYLLRSKGSCFHFIDVITD